MSFKKSPRFLLCPWHVPLTRCVAYILVRSCKAILRIAPFTSSCLMLALPLRTLLSVAHNGSAKNPLQSGVWLYSSVSPSENLLLSFPHILPSWGLTLLTQNMNNLLKSLCPAVGKQALAAIIKIILLSFDWDIIKQKKRLKNNWRSTFFSSTSGRCEFSINHARNLDIIWEP